jgi:ribosomal-protein-alanine N-acetyltransferase
MMRAEVFLRPLVDADVGEQYLAWMNDPVTTRFLESRFTRWTSQALLDHVRRDARSETAASLAICLAGSNRHVGNVRLSSIDRYHGHASLGLLVGEKDCRARGIGTSAIQLACAHAFGTLGLRRVTAGCYASNTASLRAFEKAGFAVEGRLRSRWRDGDSFVDGIIVGLVRSETENHQ